MKTEELVERLKTVKLMLESLNKDIRRYEFEKDSLEKALSTQQVKTFVDSVVLNA